MICPNCQSDVAVAEKDFGALFNCPKCNATYFLNFDGAPEYSNEPPPDLSSTHDAISEPEIGQPDPFSNEAPAVASFSSEQKFSEPFATLESSEFQEVVPSFEQPIAADASIPFSVNETDGPGSLLEPQFGESAFSNVASDISNFGNSETQITSLNYDLRIAGLDTREDLLAFKEMIEDSRFAWDVSDLMKQIKNGQLFLPRLNPVQAYILAKRLHFLDLELKWKQNVLE